MVFSGEFADVFGDAHAAKVRAAHAAEMSGLRALGRKSFVVIFSGAIGIERQVELIVPAEFEPSFRQRVVAVLRARMSFGEIRGVGGDLVGDHAFFDVLFVWETKVFFGRDVTRSEEHTSELQSLAYLV